MTDPKTLMVSTNTARGAARALPAEFGLRPCNSDDIEALGALYFAAYPSGVACATLEEAVADIRATFSGEYGAFMPHASPLVTRGEAIVGAVLTVRRAPWPDTPGCPFVVEVFTAPDQRRQGFASAALMAALMAVRDDGESALALRVTEHNLAAMAVYAKLGFQEWDGAPVAHR